MNVQKGTLRISKGNVKGAVMDVRNVKMEQIA